MSNTVGAAQAPAPGALNLDHIAHFVPDIAAASAALIGLGFTLTPFSAQSHRLQPEGPLVPAGTGNQCIMLERGYLEVLTPTGDTPIAQQLRQAIERYVGVQLIAFGTASPEADHARLLAEGFEPLSPVDLQRPIATPTGEDVARFTVVRVPPGKMEEGRIQFCQHRTPDLLWQPRWLAHANGALGLAAVLICVEDPQRAAARYSRYTGVPTTRKGAGWELATARGSVMFFDPDVLYRQWGVTAPGSPWIAGYALQAADLAATRDFMDQADVEVITPSNDSVRVMLPPSLGGILMFIQQGSTLRLD